jgi:serine phosphatase RsbU (regulator of sigma subunit)
MAEEIEAAVSSSSRCYEPMQQPIQIDSLYVPCVDLGGDTFGYHWIDDDHLAVACSMSPGMVSIQRCCR